LSIHIIFVSSFGGGSSVDIKFSSPSYSQLTVEKPEPEPEPEPLPEPLPIEEKPSSWHCVWVAESPVFAQQYAGQDPQPSQMFPLDPESSRLPESVIPRKPRLSSIAKEFRLLTIVSNITSFASAAA
jgi:hypothetical protein